MDLSLPKTRNAFVRLQDLPLLISGVPGPLKPFRLRGRMPPNYRMMPPPFRPAFSAGRSGRTPISLTPSTYFRFRAVKSGIDTKQNPQPWLRFPRAAALPAGQPPKYQRTRYIPAAAGMPPVM